MKTFKKVLCLLLSIVMIFGTVSTVAMAEDGAQLSYSDKYVANRDDKVGADLLLDELDKLLADMDIKEEVDLTVTKITIDLTSVNGLCDTLDLLKTLLTGLQGAIVKAALGDLGDDVNFSTWEKDMTRGSQDITILKELIELLGANASVISGVISNNNGEGYSLGVLDSFIDLNDLLGEDGVSGIIKEAIFGIVADDDAQADAYYSQYKNDVDAFVYGPLLQELAGEYLAGFTMDASTTVEDLICAVFNAVLDEYVVSLIAELNVDLASSEVAVLQKLAPYINLKGSTYDLSDIKLDANAPLEDQLNDLVGKVFAQIVPTYKDKWVSGSWTNISENIEGLLKYVASESGVIENAASMTLDEVVMAVIGIILDNVDLGNLENGVAECKTLEDMAKAALINAARDMDITYQYSNDESYLVVLGDIIAAFMYDNFNITDLNGAPYRGSQGDDLWTVLNYVWNYFLFDEGINDFVALGSKKTDTFFNKLDSVLDYFGETKAKGVSFDSKVFLLGNSKEKGLLDSVFTLDIENILAITIIPALETAGDVSAVEFIYNTLKNVLNNWSGKTMLSSYVKGAAFTNLLSNNGIANIANALLSVLNERINSFVVLVMFVTTFFLEGEIPTLDAATATISNFTYTGNVATPKVTVKVGSTTLTQNVDYIVLTDAKDMGTATATIKGIGLYEGKLSASYKIVLGNVSGLKTTSTTTGIKLSWSKVTGADKYNVYIDGKLKATVTGTSKNFTDIASGVKSFKFKVEAVDNESGSTSSASITASTLPAKVTSLKAASKTTNSVKLTWKAISGVTGYRVDQKVNGSWKKIATVTTNSYTVSKLSPYTSYEFRVRAYVTNNGAADPGEYSSTLSVRTALGVVDDLKVSTKSSTTVTLKWGKVTNATGYTVYKSTDGKTWTKVASTTSTSYKVTKLTAKKKYYFKVAAYSKATGKAVYTTGDVISAYTKLVKTSKVTVKSTTATTAKLSWSKVSGATKYIVYKSTDKKTWTKAASVEGTSATVKKLSSGTKYYFKVVPYSSKIKTYGDDSSVVTAYTVVGKVTNLKSTSRTRSTIKLSWSKTTGAKGYTVYKSTDGKKWTKVASTTGTTYTVKELSKNTTYYFKVKAYSKATGETVYGAFSDSCKVKTTRF